MSQQTLFFSASRWPALLIGFVLVGAIAAAAGTRIFGLSIREPDAPAARVLELRFEDRADGSVAVIDTQRQRQIDRIEGEEGFVRGTLRGFARERRLRGIGPTEPLVLVARTDGRLTLMDPATSRIVDLESFGPANAGRFAVLFSR